MKRKISTIIRTYSEEYEFYHENGNLWSARDIRVRVLGSFSPLLPGVFFTCLSIWKYEDEEKS